MALQENSEMTGAQLVCMPSACLASRRARTGMPARKNPLSEAERSRRFVEKDKELGADKPTEAFDRVLEKMMPPRRPSKIPTASGGSARALSRRSLSRDRSCSRGPG